MHGGFSGDHLEVSWKRMCTFFDVFVALIYIVQLIDEERYDITDI